MKEFVLKYPYPPPPTLMIQYNTLLIPRKEIQLSAFDP